MSAKVFAALVLAVLLILLVILWARQTIKPPISEVRNTCRSDADCVLIDVSLDYSTCWPGACGKIDYSQNNYEALNADSFEDFLKQIAPDKSICGPAPACPETIINAEFKAVCESGICLKKAK